MRILYFQNQNPETLAGLAEACLSLTPKIYTHKQRAIYLDIAPTQKLFAKKDLSGEEAIFGRAEKLIRSFGLPLQIVLTDRPEWAEAFISKKNKAPILIPAGQSHLFLLSLPIERIFYCGDPNLIEEEEGERIALVAFMKRVGLRQISDFSKLTVTAIGRRFGKLGIQLQQWVMGTRELCLPLFVPEESIRETLDTESLGSLEQLIFCLGELFVRIEARLVGRGSLARELKLTFHLDSGNKMVKPIKFSEPIRDAKSFLKLLREFLNEVTWDSPLQSIDVAISDLIPFCPGQLSLFDSTENRFTELGAYIERLKQRFGEQAVGFADLQESYLPERSWKTVFPPSKRILPTRDLGLRPPVLYSPPKPYHPTRNCRLIPAENLDTEWWQEGGHRRYFITQSPQGERLWIFWDGQRQEWFVQGTFD